MAALVPFGQPPFLSQPTLVTQPAGYVSPYDYGYGSGYGPGASPRLYYPRRQSRLSRATEALLLNEEADRLRMLEAEYLAGYGYGYRGYGAYGAYGPYGYGYGYPYERYYGGHGGY